MKCQEFEERLHRRLDDRQPPEADGQLAAHADDCPACRRLLTGQRVLLAGLRHWSRPPLGGEFSQRVLARHRSEPAEAVVLDGNRRTGRMRWLLAGLVATAAAVLVGVTIIAYSPLASRPNIAVNPPRGKKPGVNRPQPAVGGLALENPGAGTRPRTEMRHPQGGGLTFFPRPAGGYGVAIADMASSLPEAVERIEEVERYAPGIRPIRISFAMLWEALWRTIPGTHSDGQHDPKAYFGQIDSRRLV